MHSLPISESVRTIADNVEITHTHTPANYLSTLSAHKSPNTLAVMGWNDARAIKSRKFMFADQFEAARER